MNPETIAALEDSLARLALALERPMSSIWELVRWQQQVEAILVLATAFLFFALIVPLTIWIGVSTYRAGCREPGFGANEVGWAVLAVSILFLVVAGILLGDVVRPAVGKLLNPGYYALERLVLLLTS